MTTVLRVWLMPSAGLRSSDQVARRLKPFLQRHRSISVELRLIPWARGWTELVHAYKHGDPPDVFQAGSTWLATLAHLHLLAPVPAGVQTRPAIAPWVDAMAIYQGVQIAVPWILECSVLAVRTHLLEEAGLEAVDLSDWNGFYESCLRFARLLARAGAAGARSVPLIAHLRPEYNTLHWAVPWLWSGGWRTFDPLSNPFRYVSDPSAFPGFSYIARLFQISPDMKEAADAPASRVQSDFFEGDRYAVYLGPSDRVMCARASPEGARRFTILPVPKGPDGSKTRAGGSWLCVPLRCKHPTAAWELVKYMSEDPFLGWRAETGGEFPAVESEYWQADHPERSLLKDILTTANTYPRHPLWRTMEYTLMQGMGELFWRFVQGHPYDETAQEIAARLDRNLAQLISLGWEIPA